MHEVTTATGAREMVATRHYDQVPASRLPERWHEHPGHVAGTYTDHRDPRVQVLAYEWRLSGKSVTAGYTALRLQDGHALWHASDQHAKSLGYKSIADARRAAGLGR